MFPSHYCFTINLPVIPPLWLKRGHHQFSWFAIFVWLWSWGAMGTSLWEEPGVYHLLAISCICFSTCAFQKSQHLWFASQTLDLVAATHVPTTTRSTEMIWGGIAEDTDSEFHVLEAGWIDKPYILNYVLGKKIDKRHVLAVNVNF